ncbi:MAG: lysophospholipid acyltransferase family protein [Bacteroidales bacterium]|nr:lysophospholipid acyltransferase family protein [Bacteroidales bacterium]
MIYRAKHHPILYTFFKLYTLWKIKRNFNSIVITGDHNNKDLPVLLISNHISWWDGFWAMYLNMKIFRRRFYFMMTEEQLKKYMFFNKTGGYSVKKGSKSVVESLDYTADLLSNGDNLVLIFPQGEINSLYARNFRFEKGLEYVLKKIRSKVHIIFTVNLPDYFSCTKPTVFMYFREYSGDSLFAPDIEKEYNLFYESCLVKNYQKKG